MKLYADIIFRNEDGLEISRVIQEETRQYTGIFYTVHKFLFDWEVCESCDKLDVINGGEEHEQF